MATQIPAAQYLRMSTDQQKLSLVYQAAAIQRYADRHGFTIVQSYRDAGRSGLTLRQRPGLRQLLQDVVGGCLFKAILVYDVSRWGRFQDTDESAYYEFLCKSARVPVYYCAELFKNNGSSPAVIMKTLKRIMAAEYSRELSQRLSRSKKILTQRGFRAGGMAGYGLRRMLLSPDGSPKRLLTHGEVKDIETGRVILVPGPEAEVAGVREIYRLRISEKRTANWIARDFNRRGITCCGAPWTGVRVLEVLRNPKYIGQAVWGRTTGPLCRKRVNVPQNQWISKSGAFEALVDQQTFDAAQGAIRDRTCNKSDDELLNALRSLLKRKGRLSQHIIDASTQVPATATYYHRFGTLRQAYERIGYDVFDNHQGMLKMRFSHRKIEQALFLRISRIFKDRVSVLRERNVCRRVLSFPGGLKISVLISQCIPVGKGHLRWVITVNRFERHYPTLICRCNPSNKSFKDFYVVPNIDTRCRCLFRIRENDSWLKRGKRLGDLSQLERVAAQVVRLDV